MRFSPLHRARNELGNSRSSELNQQPDANHLEGSERAVRPWEQAEYHQAEAQIVRFRQGVQAGQGIGEAKQPDCAAKKKKAPAVTMRIVKRSRAISICSVPLAWIGTTGTGDECDRCEGGEQRKRHRDVHNRGIADRH